MFQISKIRLKSHLIPVKAQKFLRCLCLPSYANSLLFIVFCCCQITVNCTHVFQGYFIDINSLNPGICRSHFNSLTWKPITQKAACPHYSDVIMGEIASQITSLTIVYSIAYSDADHRKHQSSASLAFVGGIHQGPVNSPHKWPVTWKMFPFHDVIMIHCEIALRWM